jgi:nucleotide-binding universal stress UspA family protein
MKKKILIAVDDSIHSKKAIAYTVNMSGIIQNLHFTVFNVQKSISQFLIDEAEKNSKIMQELYKVIKTNEIASFKILEKYKDFMIHNGVGPDRIEIISRLKIDSVAKDIMVFGQNNLFDAVFVGRRGASRIQKTFMGSVTANILEHCTAIPVWLIDGTVMNSKIMVAVDGSDSSRRAIDHLSFMVEGDSPAEIMLFHVASSVQKMFAGRADRKKNDLEEVISESLKGNIDHFVSSAIDKFEKAGLKKDSVRVKISKRFLNPGRAIIEESQKGDYGTVVLGRSGISRSVFTGSVSRYVINHISNRVLCMVS